MIKTIEILRMIYSVPQKVCVVSKGKGCDEETILNH
jgi:hypothetical protein